MPTYVYRCKKGHVFELFHSISDESKKRCPKCRSGAVRVPAGGAGFLFKGSGFYVTDYRSKGYKDSGLVVPAWITAELQTVRVNVTWNFATWEQDMMRILLENDDPNHRWMWQSPRMSGKSRLIDIMES